MVLEGGFSSATSSCSPRTTPGWCTSLAPTTTARSTSCRNWWASFLETRRKFGLKDLPGLGQFDAEKKVFLLPQNDVNKKQINV